MYPLKLIVGLIASLLVFVGYAPYIKDTLKGKTKPHAYTWFIWAFVTLAVFFFQYNGGGGAGRCWRLPMLRWRGGKNDVVAVWDILGMMGVTGHAYNGLGA